MSLFMSISKPHDWNNKSKLPNNNNNNNLLEILI